MAPIIKPSSLSPYSNRDIQSTKSLFDMKMAYDTLAQLTYGTNIIDFQLGEYNYYGRMNLISIPIVLNKPGQTTTNSLSSIKRSADSSAPLSALKFVGILFEQMASQFDKAVTGRKISSKEKYLSNLKIYRAYESPWLKYQEYKKEYFKQISEKLRALPEEQKFKNIKEFLNFLTDYLKGPSSMVPFTYPSFIKSRFNDIMSSGLAIEIADIDYSNDQEKVQHFLRSPNWSYYVNACNQHGFIIDKQNPFRLVADINSSAMINVAQGTVNAGGYNLLDRVYVPAAQPYLQSIVGDLISLYNMSTSEYLVETSVCPEGKTRKKFKKTPRYNFNSFFETVSVKDVLYFYMITRINEQKPDMEIKTRNQIINDSLEYYSINNNLSLVLTVFEAVVSSTVDKMGSFAYYEKQVKELLHSESTNEADMSNVTPFSAGGGY